jgi:hypothetical protein
VISDRPDLEGAFPPAVRAGKSTSLAIVGRNLPGGRPAGGGTLEVLTRSVHVPAIDPARARFPRIERLLAPSLNMPGIQLCPKELGSVRNGLTLLSTDIPITLEREPNDTADTAQALPPTALVCGRFDRPGDTDWYTIAAKADQPIAIELFGERLGVPGDARVVVIDAQGNDVATIDDHGIDKGGTELFQTNRDPMGLFTPPADGMYRLLVQETYGQGGALYVYALRVGPPRPDFAPVAFFEDPNEPGRLVVRAGGSASCEVCLNRRDGFAGTVTIEAEGLPAGVTASPILVDPRSEFGDVVFTAAAEAPEWAGTVRLKAWATIYDKRIVREVIPITRRWANVEPQVPRATRQLGLSIRPGAPYALRLPTEAATVVAGSSFEVPVNVARLQANFDDVIQVTGLNPPAGFDVPATDLSHGAPGATLKIAVAADVPPGRYTLVLRGDAQVPDPASGDGNRIRVADPSTPMTVAVTAPPEEGK